jgi:hypothetical protein
MSEAGSIDSCQDPAPAQSGEGRHLVLASRRRAVPSRAGLVAWPQMRVDDEQAHAARRRPTKRRRSQRFCRIRIGGYRTGSTPSRSGRTSSRWTASASCSTGTSACSNSRSGFAGSGFPSVEPKGVAGRDAQMSAAPRPLAVIGQPVTALPPLLTSNRKLLWLS